MKFKFGIDVDNNIKGSDIKEFLSKYKENIGWSNLRGLSDEKILSKIEKISKEIREKSSALIVIGIGGSYLGSKAVIDSLSGYYEKDFDIYYLGNTLSTAKYNDLLKKIKGKDIYVNVISKSGTTFETTIFYNLIKEYMIEKYDDKYKERIIVTTDSDDYIREEVNRHGYRSFLHPEDIGGRYSLFTPVHLLPICVSGFDIRKLFKGAIDSYKEIKIQMEYALVRKKLYDNGKTVEAYVVYEEKLNSLVEWIKQLYAESLGKEGKGILPIGLINTRDLHSIGQYVQDGTKMIFETVISVKESKEDILIEEYNTSLHELNMVARDATIKAHKKGKVISNLIELEKLDEYNLGFLMQFMMLSCAISGYVEKVNPFDQPGVEEYKKEMKKML